MSPPSASPTLCSQRHSGHLELNSFPKQPESASQIWADLFLGPILWKLDHSDSVCIPGLEEQPRSTTYRAYRWSLDVHLRMSTVCGQWPLQGGRSWEEERKEKQPGSWGPVSILPLAAYSQNAEEADDSHFKQAFQVPAKVYLTRQDRTYFI